MTSAACRGGVPCRFAPSDKYWRHPRRRAPASSCGAPRLRRYLQFDPFLPLTTSRNERPADYRGLHGIRTRDQTITYVLAGTVNPATARQRLAWRRGCSG
jgi:hypothetical protein